MSEILQCNAEWSENVVSVLRSAAVIAEERVSLGTPQIDYCAQAKTKEPSLQLVLDHLQGRIYNGSAPDVVQISGMMLVTDARNLKWVRRKFARGLLAKLLRGAGDGIAEKIPLNLAVRRVLAEAGDSSGLVELTKAVGVAVPRGRGVKRAAQ